jgi:hypothetical protein
MMSIYRTFWQTVVWGLTPANVCVGQGARSFSLSEFERPALVLVKIWANKRGRMLFRQFQMKAV